MAFQRIFNLITGGGGFSLINLSLSFHVLVCNKFVVIQTQTFHDIFTNFNTNDESYYNQQCCTKSSITVQQLSHCSAVK